MRAHKRRPSRYASLLVLLIAIVVAGCSCSAKPAEDTSPSTPLSLINVDDLYRFSAFTAWSCTREEPVIFIRLGSHKSREDLHSTIEHELNHAAFAMSFPSCETWNEWRRGDEAKLTMEALAACAGLRTRIAQGDSVYEASLNSAARGLAQGYGIEGLTVERARARIEAVCP